MAAFSLSMPQGTAPEMAEELERIAGQIREGFTSGYTYAGGPWSSETDPEPDLCEVCGSILTGDDGADFCAAHDQREA
jgi:hypothetical protein